MTETFTDLGTGWIVSPMGNASGWSASNGIYRYSGIGLSQTCAGNPAWSNYIFDANIQLSLLSNWPGGVRARVNPSTGAGYVVWMYPGSSQIILYKVGTWNINDSSLTQLAAAHLNFDTTATHDLQIAFQGNTISVRWDGTFLMSAADTAYASGFVCLDANSQPISYSNVRVSATQSVVQLDTPSPASITFAALPGATPPPQTVNVSAGGAATTWGISTSAGAPWLATSVSTTLTPGVITVSANPAGLAEGTYNATITLSAPGATNSPITIPVTLAVKTAVMSVSPTTLNFFGAPNFNPVSETFQVLNLGTGTLNWTATVTSSWLGVSALSGAAPSTVTVAPNTSTITTGNYSDTITVSSRDVTNSPATISISTHVGTLLFSDNFSGGAGNWTIGPLGFASGWSVVNGAYTYNGGGHTQSWAGSSSWTDYTVATNFQLSSTSDYPGGLRGRLNPTTGASYGAWIYPAEGTIRLFRIGQWNIDAGNTILATISGLTIDTKAHNIRLSFKGSTIQVYYDNALVATATDATYAQGAVALDVSNQPISFSNVSVISLP
jgi:Viral BACON domain